MMGFQWKTRWPIYLKLTVIGVLILLVIQLQFRWDNVFSPIVCGNSFAYKETSTAIKKIPFNFTSTSNTTGFSDAIVPNIVHLIKFRTNEIDFVEMINIRSIIVNHRPDRLIIHCNTCSDDEDIGRVTMKGNYWGMLLREGFGKTIEVSLFEEPTRIFGQALTSVYHASDIARMQILLKYGGIFLDNDVYVVRPLHEFRHYEISIGWDEGQFLGTQVIIAHKDARFLKLWMNSYRNYQGDKWYFNAGEYPTTSILHQHPELVHRVKIKFGVHMLIHHLYQSNWKEWTDMYTIHLLIRHRDYLDSESPVKVFDENNIKSYNFTYGQMARSLLYNLSDLIK